MKEEFKTTEEINKYFLLKTIKSAIVFGSGRLMQFLLITYLGIITTSEVLGIYETVYAFTIIGGSFGTLGLATFAVTQLPKYITIGDHGLTKGCVYGFWGVILLTSALSGAIITASCLYFESMPVFPCLLLCGFIPAFGLHRFQRAVSRSMGFVSAAVMPEFLLWPAITLVAVTFGTLLLPVDTTSADFYILASLGGIYVALFLQLIYIFKKIPVEVKDAKLKSEWKRWLKLGSLLMFADGAFIIVAKTDVVMIQAMRGFSETGIYAVGVAIAEWVRFPFLVSNVIGPKLFSSLIVQKRNEELQSLLQYVVMRVFSISVLIAVCICLSSWYFLSSMGEQEYVNAYPVVIILIVANLIDTACGSVGWLLQSADYTKLTACSYVFGAALNIILNLILIPLLGIWGAAIGTGISLACRNILQVVIVRRMMGVDPSILALFKSK